MLIGDGAGVTGRGATVVVTGRGAGAVAVVALIPMRGEVIAEE